jgi:hypothetical protein
MTLGSPFLLKEQSYSDIPDEWKSITDIPPFEEMIQRIKQDSIFADSFFLQETNNTDNEADGTYQPLADFQGYIFETLDTNDTVWIQGARGSAKSYTTARWVVGFCLRNPGVKVGIFAPSFRQSKQFWDYCALLISQNSKIDAHVYKLEQELAKDPVRGAEVKIEFRNGSFIEALPSGDGSKLRGKRYNVIIIDEAYLLDEEFHRSHIMPMGNVKLGKINTKVIYLTTSWYAEVYAYSILKTIAARIAAGVPGYAIIDIQLQDVLASETFPFDKKHIIAQLEDQADPVSGKLSDEAKMTFFNVWIKSGTQFYTPSVVQGCMRTDVPVLAKGIEDDKRPMIMGVDPATIGEDKCAFSIGFAPGNDMRQLCATYQETKLTSKQIAGYIHKMVDRYPQIKLICMDKTGAMGAEIAEHCGNEEQLIDGQLVKRQPIMLWDHPDARNSRCQIVLTKPSDERIKIGVYGRRFDASVGGEADLKNALHLNMKSAMENGKFVTPKLVKDSEYYDSECGGIMDAISESMAQFPRIDRKKMPDGKTLIVDARGNFTWTRPMRDDGAYSQVYFNYGCQIWYKMHEGRREDGRTTWLWSSSADERKEEQQDATHQIILARL